MVFEQQLAACRHSGPQGRVEPLTIIDDPADWKSSDLKPEDYTYKLSEREIAEIIAATEEILARGVKHEEDFKMVCSSCNSGTAKASVCAVDAGRGLCSGWLCCFQYLQISPG